MNQFRTDAWLDGWHAHRLGISVDDGNPFGEKATYRSHLQWISGWCSRFAAVKHGDPLIYDEVLT